MERGIDFDPGIEVDWETGTIPFDPVKIPIEISKDIADAIDFASNWHPELSLKSIRLTSRGEDSNHLLKKIKIALIPDENSHMLPTVVVEHDAPFINWPANQTYIEATPVNLIDYLREEGTFVVEITIHTRVPLGKLTLDVEVCTDGKVSVSL